MSPVGQVAASGTMTAQSPTASCPQATLSVLAQECAPTVIPPSVRLVTPGRTLLWLQVTLPSEPTEPTPPPAGQVPETRCWKLEGGRPPRADESAAFDAFDAFDAFGTVPRVDSSICEPVSVSPARSAPSSDPLATLPVVTALLASFPVPTAPALRSPPPIDPAMMFAWSPAGGFPPDTVPGAMSAFELTMKDATAVPPSARKTAIVAITFAWVRFLRIRLSTRRLLGAFGR